MTFSESNNSNTFKAKGISLKILEPDIIVLPIPQNPKSVDTFGRIEIDIINNTSIPFPFIYSRLIPELVTPNGIILKPQKPIGRQIKPGEYDGILIPPKRIFNVFLNARLFGKNKLLQLRAKFFKYSEALTSADNFWVFEALELGTYKLRCIYNSSSSSEELLDFDSTATGDTGKKVLGIEFLTTPFVNLRLVEPVGVDQKAVEVNGIRFETVLPEQIFSIPLNQSDVEIPVRIGMQITNNASTPFRFCSFDTLIPELAGVDGLIPPQSSGGSAGWVSPRETDFQLVIPGECMTFFANAYLECQATGLLKLIVPGGGRACWSFNELKLGKYQIQLTYRTPTAESDVLFEDLWMGMVHTPFREFCLVPL